MLQSSSSGPNLPCIVRIFALNVSWLVDFVRCFVYCVKLVLTAWTITVIAVYMHWDLKHGELPNQWEQRRFSPLTGEVIWHKWCDHINIKQLWPVEGRKTKQTKQAMEPLHEQQATLPYLCSCQTPCCSFKWQQVLRVKKKHIFIFFYFNNLQHVIICTIYKAWVLPQSKTQKYRKEGKICAVVWCWFKMLIICGATVL